MVPAGSGYPPTILNLTNTCNATTGVSEIAFSCNKVIAGSILTVNLTDKQSGAAVWSDGFGVNTNQLAFFISGTANGSDYVLNADNGEASVSIDLTVNCTGTPPPVGGGGAPPPTPAPTLVYGCTDPGADNYDPAATSDDGSCAYTPRLALATALPELAPVGVPLVATLASAPVVGATAAPASVVLDLANLLSTAVAVPSLTAWVRVDGYLFTFGPLIVPGRFLDAASLLDALRAQPVLAASYVLRPAGPKGVQLTARTPGLPGTPTVSVSNVLLVAVTPTAGVAGLHSQRRQRWGCFLEVWAGCGNVFGGPVSKGPAVLAQRLPLDYRADNVYAFDIASALRQFTGHAYPLADGSCPDRLVSYFVRYGEEYADALTGLRTVRTVYESEIAWGLEAMELPALVRGVYMLSARPGAWPVAVGDKVPAWLLGKPNPNLRTVVRYRLATARTTTDYLPGHDVAGGQVTQANDRLRVAAGALSGELLLRDAVRDTEDSFARLQFNASGPALTFANRQGGFDTVYFGGTSDPGSKRTAAGFTNSAGAQQLSAEVALPTRLVSGLLDFAGWDWLRRELGVSPAAWLETSTGPQAVRLADVAAEGDPITGNYSVTVDYETDPVRGLSN
jgi:hypothetical protein